MKTILFDGYSEKRSEGGFKSYVGVDNQINAFIEENDVEILDIQISSHHDGELPKVVALVTYQG